MPLWGALIVSDNKPSQATVSVPLVLAPQRNGGYLMAMAEVLEEQHGKHKLPIGKPAV